MADFIDFYNHRRHHEGLDKRDAGGCLLRAARLQPTPSQLSVAQALPMRQWLQIAASMGLENGPRRRPGRADRAAVSAAPSCPSRSSASRRTRLAEGWPTEPNAHLWGMQAKRADLTSRECRSHDERVTCVSSR